MNRRARSGSPISARPRGSSPRGMHTLPNGALKAALAARAGRSSCGDATPLAAEGSVQPDDEGREHPPDAAELDPAVFLSLPRDAMEVIMLCLRPHDIINCARVCHALRTAAYSEQLWQTICERQFANTAPHSWLAPAAENTAADASSAIAESNAPPVASQGSAPTTYRCLAFGGCASDSRHPQRQLQ